MILNPFRKRFIPIHLNIINISVPAMIALIAEPLLGIVDTAFVGHYGTLELSVLAIITSFLTGITWLFNFFVSGTTAGIAFFNGKRDKKSMRDFFIQNQILAFVLGIILIIAGILFETRVFEIMGGDNIQRQTGHIYYLIRLSTFPFIFSYFISMGFFRAIKNMRTPMIITLSVNVLNGILDYFLIYGIEGYLPSYGLKGAAIATVFSQMICFLSYIIIIYRKHPYILFSDEKFVFNKALTKFMFKINYNLFFRTFFLISGFTVATAVASRMGKTIVGAHQIGMQLWLFCSFAIDSFAIAGQTLAGNLSGKNSRNLRGIYGILLQYWGFLLGIIFCSFLFIFKDLIISLFTTDTEIIKMVSSIYFFILIFQPLNGLTFILDGFLVGALDTRFLMWQSFVTGFLVFVPWLLYINYMKLGIVSVWISISIFLVLRFLFNEIRFIRKWV